MKRNSGFVFADTLIGMFILFIAVMLVTALCAGKNSFRYDFGEEEMRDIWENARGQRVYQPHPGIEEVIPLLPQPDPVVDTPLLN